MSVALLWATFAWSSPSTAVDAATAVVTATRHLPATGARAELSERHVGGRDRQVWSVHLDQPATTAFVAPIVLVDPDSGLVLRVEEGAIDAAPLAHVFPRNPALDPEPIEVSLEGAELGLSDHRLEVRQCRDLGETRTTYANDGTIYDLHVCSEVPAMGPRPDSDYVYPPIPWPWEPARDEDHFVASHLFWSVRLGFDWFEDLGWVPDPSYDPRVDVVANQRVTDLIDVSAATDPNLALYTYNNAYHQRGYRDWEDRWVAPRLVFGQGSVVDFGYDTDVVIHELAHLIVSSSLGPSYSTDGAYGPRVEANALNEGIADYFACAMLGDPDLAEYAAGPDRELIRTLEGDASCRADLYGESHYDSLPFSQGLWAIRAELAPSDQRLLDQAVLASLAVLGRETDFAEAFEVVPTEVDARLGEAVGDALRAEWQARFVHDCAPIVDVVASGEVLRSFTEVPAFFEYSERELVPGRVQFRVDVPEPGTTVKIEANQLRFLGIDLYGETLVGPIAVVGGSAERITWTHEPVDDTITTSSGSSFTFEVTDWQHDAASLGQLEEVGVGPYEPRPDRYDQHAYALELVVEQAGPFVFQFVNDAERSVALRDLTVTLTPPRSEDERAACGCATGAAPGPLPLALLGLLALRRRRSA